MKWFKKNVDDKIFNFYAVMQKDHPNQFLSVVVTQDQALEYVMQKIKIEKFPHYRCWCDLRSYDYKEDKCWLEYFNTSVTQEEKDEFLITPVKYKFKDLAAIIRMFGNCMPLGCSFDTPIETSYLKTLIQINEQTKKWQESIENGEDDINGN